MEGPEEVDRGVGVMDDEDRGIGVVRGRGCGQRSGCCGGDRCSGQDTDHPPPPKGPTGSREGDPQRSLGAPVAMQKAHLTRGEEIPAFHSLRASDPPARYSATMVTNSLTKV